MLKRILLALMLCVGIGTGCAPGFSNRDACAGAYAVGTAFDYTQFNSQPRYGITGYIVLELNGALPMGGGSALYHTHTNHSKFGSETIAWYTPDGWVSLGLVTWIPDGTGASPNNVDYDAHDNLTGQDISDSYYKWYKTFYIHPAGSANGYIEPAFTKYTTTATLEGESKKVIRFDNVSDWDPNGSWREVTRLFNYNTSNWDVVMDITWTASKDANYATANEQGKWAGTAETFGSNFASWNGKEIGNYSMCFIGSSGLFSSMVAPYCTLKTSDGTTGMTVVNPSPLPSYWLGRKQ